MEIVARATALFFFVLVLTRSLGKKELAQLTAVELILFVVIGDLIQQGVTQEDQSITGAMLAVGTIALLIVALSYVSYRWPRTRRIVLGVPVVVVRNGQVVQEALKLERLDLEELLESARQQGIGDLADVRVAILEPSGQVSFIKSDGDQQPSRERRPG